MKRFFLLVCLTLPAVAFSQSNFQKGYMITTSKDTVRGYIDYKERERNPTSFTFKSLNGDTRLCNLENSLGYGVDGQVTFQRYTVNITTSVRNPSKLSIGIDTSLKREAVFLNLLQKGKHVSLFSYVDQIKQRFYVFDQDSTGPTELIRQVYYDSDNDKVIKVQHKYINQLVILLRKYRLDQKDENKLIDLKYYKSDLLRAILLINQEEAVKPKFAPARFYTGVGLNFSKVKYTGLNEFNSSQAINKEGYLAPYANFGIDVFINPAIRKLILRTDILLTYGEFNFSATTTDIARAAVSHRFNQFNIALTPQLIYNVYNKASMKLFFGGGIGLNYAVYNNNISTRYNSAAAIMYTEKDKVELEKFYYTVPLTVGTVIGKKIELSAGYSFPLPISDYNDYNIVMTKYRVGVAYLFGKN